MIQVTIKRPVIHSDYFLKKIYIYKVRILSNFFEFIQFSLCLQYNLIRAKLSIAQMQYAIHNHT